MSLDAFLLSILVDPEDKGSLWYFADEAALYNPRLRRRYPVRDGIPVLLVTEAENVDDAEAARLRRARQPPSSRVRGRRAHRTPPATEG